MLYNPPSEAINNLSPFYLEDLLHRPALSSTAGFHYTELSQARVARGAQARGAHLDERKRTPHPSGPW